MQVIFFCCFYISKYAYSYKKKGGSKMDQGSKKVKEPASENLKSADDIKKACGCGCLPVESNKQRDLLSRGEQSVILSKKTEGEKWI